MMQRKYSYHTEPKTEKLEEKITILLRSCGMDDKSMEATLANCDD